MDLGIAGRKAIVCASSKGLGRACAMALAEAGCEIVVSGRNADELARTGKAISESTGAAVREVPGDLDDPATREALIAACPEADILVNNNGGPPFKPFAAITREDVLKGVQSNMLTPIALVQALLPGMAARKFGRIVNITSGSVRAPIAGLDVSSGARAGLTAFLASAARAHVSDNVTINSIQPGTFDTDRIRSSLERTVAERGIPLATARTEAKARNPARRFGDPAEFGALCAFLASARAGFITGQNILIDGGAFPGAF
jgi:3-oxoacyl-[acyl-carrier protein] reductase